MERRFEVRLEAMLEECEVSPRVFEGVTDRLREFVEPFAASLKQPVQRERVAEYLSGLVSDLERKNVESIAYRLDQDRRNMQHFIGTAEWDHQPLFLELARQVGQEVGEDDAVIVFDPSAFPKQGRQSVGVQRQWCGRLGKVENCQVAVYMAYVSRQDHVLVNTRLYLPEDWAKDRKRRKAAGVPKSIKFQTRHQLALEMLEEQGELLPHGWVAGDDEMGKVAWFRRDLHERHERYLLAVPGDTLIRDLEADPPESCGRGRAKKTPFVRIDRWRDAVSEDAWTRIKVRDAEKGPLEVEVVSCRVETKCARRVMPHEETLVIIRSLDQDGVTKYDFYLSDAERETPDKEFVRVACSAHRIEEAIKRGKSEAGLSHYEVRNWRGWHHHQILSLLASWFLVRETQRGKKMDPRDDAPADPRRDRHAVAVSLELRHPHQDRPTQNPPPDPK
jgi:SRSO17 transposase